MRKKRVSLFLALMLMLPLLVQSASVLAEDRPTISYYAYWCGSLDPQSYVEQYIEDHIDMDIEVRKVTHTDKEAVNLMLASGDMPDCGWFEHTYAQMKDEELIRTIPVELVEEYMPGYMELCEKYPMIKALALDPEDETQFRYFPDVYLGNYNLHNNCMYLRYDWIKKLGIDLDVNIEQIDDRLYIADNGITRDEFHEILDGFVNKDPDGNGEDDTFGLLKDWSVALVPSQGILVGANMDIDGKPVEWAVNPELKEVLLYAQELYAEGLIYPEIFTVQWGEDWELINNSKAGVLAGNAVATVWLQSWASNRPPLSLFQANEDAELLMIPGIVGPDGECHHVRPYSPGRWERFYVNADVDDEQLINILKFLDFCYFSGDDDVIATLVFGEKGVDWDFNEEGVPVLHNVLQNGERGTQVFARNMIFGKQYDWTLQEDLFKSGLKYYIEDYGGIWNDMMRYTYKADIFDETDANEYAIEYGQDWAAVQNAYFMGVIMGEKNVEEDWDQYIEDLNDLYYSDYVEELAKAPSIVDVLEEYSEK